MTLLDSHPELVVYPEESGYFRRFEPQAAHSSDQERLHVAEELILRIFNWDPADPHPSQAGFPDRDYSDIDFEQVREAFRARAIGEGEASRTILPAAVVAYGEVAGMLRPATRRWVEKTPYNEQFADRIFALWPEAKCIHVVRDPRDNYASYRRKHPDWSEWTFARSWQRSLLRGIQNRARYGASRYWIMRYEDLILRPEAVLTELVEFLEIDMDASLRTPTRAGKPWGGNSMFGERFEGISDSPVGRYRRSLSSTSTRRLETALHPLMREFRYTVESPIGLKARTVGWIVRASWLLRGVPPVPGIAPGDPGA
jgi:hypothetical protein